MLYSRFVHYGVLLCLIISGYAEELRLLEKALANLRTNALSQFTFKQQLIDRVTDHHKKVLRSLQSSSFSVGVPRVKSRPEPRHPFIVELSRACVASPSTHCHDLLREHQEIGEGRYEIISPDIAIVSLSLSQLQSANRSLVSDFLALAPELKLAKEVSSMKIATHASSCLKSKSSFNGKYPSLEKKSEKSKTTTSSHPFKLRFMLHAPASLADYEDFLAFLSELEDEFNVDSDSVPRQKTFLGQAKRNNNQKLVLEEIVLSTDESDGYYGERRAKALRSSTVSAWKKNPHRLSFASRSRNIPKNDKIVGDIYITDCSLVYDIAMRLAARPEVVSVSRHFPHRPLNHYAEFTCDTGVYNISSPVSLLQEGPDAATDVIGFSDTGIDMRSCYFRDENRSVNYQTSLRNVVLNPNHRKIVQYISFADDKESNDGHGTHVAGSLAGYALPSSGSSAAMNNGISSKAKLAFFDIGKSDSEYLKTPVDLNKEMFQKLLPSGAKIFSVSWGSVANYYDSDAHHIDSFMWDNPDTLVVLAAGNEGEDGPNTVGAPATAKNLLSVGAGFSDNLSFKANTGKSFSQDVGKDTVAYFSSQGPTEDGRMKPDIIAPGYYIYSALGTNSSSTAPTCETVKMAGTSMATPVAASFALSVRRYFLDGFYPSGNKVDVDGFVPSGALIKAMMIHSAVPMKLLNEKNYFKNLKYPSIVQGYGRLNLSSTLKFNRGVFSNGEKIPPRDLFVIGAATSSPYLAPSNNPRRTLYQAFTTKNSRHTYYVRTNSSSSNLAAKSPLPLRLTLCFTDYPASAKALKVAINKLALSVTVNGTLSYAPYQGHGAFTTATDDNTQRIDIPDAAVDAVYAISVTATQLQTTGQSYALVVTGAFTVLNDGVPTVTYGVPAPTLAPSRYGL